MSKFKQKNRMNATSKVTLVFIAIFILIFITIATLAYFLG